jgi:hypothetical protein
MKQREKCIKAANALIEQGTSVVVGTYTQNPNYTPHETYATYVC